MHVQVCIDLSTFVLPCFTLPPQHYSEKAEMMTEIQEVSLNRAEIAARRDKDDLLDCLDDLLEHYLHTLHEYHKVMNELSTQLSSVCQSELEGRGVVG